MTSLIHPGLLNCKACPLHEGRRRVVPGFGKRPASVLFISEAPGGEEDKRGKPFVGRAGKLLAGVCDEIGWNLDRDVFRTNTVRCRPPENRDPLAAEIRACKGFLDLDFQAVDPDVVVLLGAVAFRQYLPDEKGKILEVRGNAYTRELFGRERVLVPTVHPAFVLRNVKAYRKWLCDDLRSAMGAATWSLKTSPARKAGSHSQSAVLPFRTTPATLTDLRHDLQRDVPVGFDLETTGLERDSQIVGVGTCTGPSEGHYLPLAEDFVGTTAARLQPWLEDPAVVKVVSNAKFERHILLGYGVALDGIEDTYLQAAVLGDEPLNLKGAIHKNFGIEMLRIESVIGHKPKKKSDPPQRTMREVQDENPALATRYAAQDPDATLRLWQVYTKRIKERGLEQVYQLELQVTPILVDMERTGMRFDSTALEGPRRALTRYCAEQLATLSDLGGSWRGWHPALNPHSYPQVSRLLYETADLALRLQEHKRGSGAARRPTDKVALAAHRANPLIHALLSYRAASKLISTYIDGLPKHVEADGRLHGEFRQIVDTGRMAMTKPNLMNIPARKREDIDLPMEGKAIRKAFVAAPGCLLYSVDLSQIEMRVAAHLSNDPVMIQALKDGDIHDTTTQAIYNEEREAVEDDEWKRRRDLAKTIGFGVLFGLTAEGLLKRTPTLDLDLDDATVFINTFYRTYRVLRAWQLQLLRLGRKQGYVETILGRRLYVPELTADDRQARGHAQNRTVNFPVQGSAADLFKMGLVLLLAEWKRRGLASRPVNVIHDELILEGPEEELMDIVAIAPLLGHGMELVVPTPVDIKTGRNWGELEPWNNTQTI